MARTGRPPKPIEEHKRTGTYDASRHNRGTLAVAIEPAPTLPHEVSPRDAFLAVMDAGVTWLGRTDLPALAMLQAMLDERGPLADAVSSGYTDRKHLRDLDKQIMSLMSELGFNPAARARLGLAEVKTQSKLEDLRARQNR
jgi:hypothetical protein